VKGIVAVQRGGTMSHVHAIVYDPPAADLPHLAVVFLDGEVLAARAAPSFEAGERFLAKMMSEFAAKIKEDREK
jgi:hypothetical protein